MGPLALLGVALAQQPQVQIVAPRGEPLPGAVAPVWVVLSEDGLPSEGAAPQVSVSAGALLRPPAELSPGVWEVLYQAPAEGSHASFAVGPEQGRVFVRVALAEPPEPALGLPAQVQGVVGQPVAIEVRSRVPLVPDQLQVATLEGQVSAVTPAPGGLALTWSPGADPFPRAVPLAVRDRRNPAETPAWTVIQLRGRARVPIQTEPGSRVTLRVGGRTYGPFAAASDGLATASIEVRPGEDLAEVLVEDSAGNVQKSSLALGGAAAPSLVAIAEERLVAGQRPPPLHLKAVDADGRPWRGPAPTCDSSLGQPGPLVSTGPGTWRTSLPALPEDAFFDVRVECALQDQARVSARIPVESATPSRLSIRAWPEDLSGDSPVAQVLVALENQIGERVAGEGLSLTADRGRVTVEEGGAPGSLRATYDGAAAVATGEDTLRARWTKQTGSGGPWDIALAAPPLDESAPTLTLRAAALDRGGLPLPGVDLTLSVDQAEVVARTDARGWASAELPRPTRLPAVLEARVGSLVRRAVLFRGAGVTPDPRALDLVAERTIKIEAGRVREVFLSADPPALEAGTGARAVVVVRLLDRSGHPVTDLPPHLEVSSGAISEPKARQDGSFEAVYTPPAGLPYGQVSVTASGAAGTPGEFRGTTTIELLPRRITRAPGLELGVLLGGGGNLSPWLSFEFDQRLAWTRLPLFARFSLGTYADHATGTDEVTGADLRMDLRLFPLSAGVLARAEGRRRATWLGVALVTAPYQLEMRLDDQLVVQGPGLTPPGFSLFTGLSWRVRLGEVELAARYLALSTGPTEVGWQGSVGGVATTLGYKLLY